MSLIVSERTREVGNSVSILDLSKERAPVANTQELLAGRVSGVTVLANSGQAGAGGSIRLRGVNSISQGNSPIIYVDGVRISNAHTPVSVGGHGDIAPLNDIDMTDVERVEVVKGPAATTLYGTDWHLSLWAQSTGAHNEDNRLYTVEAALRNSGGKEDAYSLVLHFDVVNDLGKGLTSSEVAQGSIEYQIQAFRIAWQ